jgi:uncharacterized protein
VITKHTLALALLIGAMATTALSRQTLRMDAKGNPMAATAASFDCTKAHGFAESSICTDSVLAMADSAIMGQYERLLSHIVASKRMDLVRRQRDWLRHRNQCTNHACLETALSEREAALRQEAGATDKALRVKVAYPGGCDDTRIDSLGPRLSPVEGEALSGTSVGFANGVWQVSYDREPEVLASRIGDPARVCLVSIPRHCPAGDDRGRVYSAENLRTHRRWRLADSSHSCGGA